MIRLFVAIDLPSKLKEELESFTKKTGIENARIVPAKNLHLTLKFLGSVKEEFLPAIEQEIGEIAKKHEEFKITLSQLGAFPSRKKARIFWVGSEENLEIQKIAESIDSCFKKFGLEGEKRKFKTHLTLARLKKSMDLSNIISKNMEQKSLIVKEITLFQSKLSPKGAQYKALNKFFLKNA